MTSVDRNAAIMSMDLKQMSCFHESYTVAENGCWLWGGPLTPKGYGYTSKKNGNCWGATAHRVSFWIHYGYLPDCIDHLCRNRACVNPKHLEAVTNRENVLRGVGVTAQNARKEFCKRGHKLPTESNIPGGRQCMTCKLHAGRAWRKKVGPEYYAKMRRRLLLARKEREKTNG